tara:strand:+ start:3326 stop:3853 length:528 start_codon:yes stop_codon:yes gene_type:complete
MDQDTLAKAIEPFFTTKGIGQGTGLGLSMVHGLTAQLGAGLAIDSEIGCGTTVHLWLPVTDACPVAEPVPDTAISQQDRGVVLVVDDEDLVRASTAHMLGEMGYSVLEANSGEAAIQLMPGITGTDLALHSRRVRPEVRVLIISGYAEAKGIALDLPRLPKPFKQSDLADSLARH